MLNSLIFDWVWPPPRLVMLLRASLPRKYRYSGRDKLSMELLGKNPTLYLFHRVVGVLERFPVNRALVPIDFPIQNPNAKAMGSQDDAAKYQLRDVSQTGSRGIYWRRRCFIVSVSSSPDYKKKKKERKRKKRQCNLPALNVVV